MEGLRRNKTVAERIEALLFKSFKEVKLRQKRIEVLHGRALKKKNIAVMAGGVNKTLRIINKHNNWQINLPEIGEDYESVL